MAQKKKNMGVRRSWTDKSGRRHYVRAKDDKEAWAKIAIAKKEYDEGNHIVDSSTKVSAWAKSWIETYKADAVGPNWYRTINNVLDGLILPEIGQMRLKDVRPVNLQQILNSKSGLSASYLKKIYNIMHEMFELACKNGLLRQNPADNLVLPKAKKAEKRRSLTQHERELMLEVAKAHRGGLFVKIMLYTGLRPSEVGALQWRCVDLKKKLIRVEASLKSDGTIGQPKTASAYRSVPIPDVLLAELEGIKHKPFDFVCTQQNGKLHTPTTLKLMWNNIKREMDILNGAKLFRMQIVVSTLAPDLYLYNLRHTYCTDLQDAGVPINVAKELMGHSDISTTSKIYTDFTETALSAAADAINRHNVPSSVPLSIETLKNAR